MLIRPQAVSVSALSATLQATASRTVYNDFQGRRVQGPTGCACRFAQAPTARRPRCRNGSPAPSWHPSSSSGGKRCCGSHRGITVAPGAGISGVRAIVPADAAGWAACGCCSCRYSFVRLGPSLAQSPRWPGDECSRASTCTQRGDGMGFRSLDGLRKPALRT